MDEEGTVLGLHVLAHEAGDVIQEGILAVKYGFGYRDLIDTFHPYLTLAEGIRLVAQALDADPKSFPAAPDYTTHLPRRMRGVRVPSS